MELILDDTFKELYELYYGDLRHQKVLGLINETFSKYDYELVNDVVNIVKTSITLGFTFTRCYDKIVAKVVEKFPIQDDIDLFILNIVLKVLVAYGAKDVEKLLSPRDIFKEVAASYFRVPQKRVTDEMISKIKDASDSFSRKPKEVIGEGFSGWDAYFYGICSQVAKNSRCYLEHTGAVLVRDRIVISTGYNGPPRGLPRCDNRWALDQEFSDKFKDLTVVETKGKCPFIAMNGLEDSNKICIGCHSESNVLVSAAMEGISTKSATLYTTGCIPCGSCLSLIINSGVDAIVVTSLAVRDSNSMYILNQSKLGVRLFDFVK